MAKAKAKPKGKAKGKKGKTTRVTMRAPGKKPVSFRKGALHSALGVPPDEKIPEAKMRAALAGRYGPKVKAMAVMARGMLAKGRRTAASHRRAAKTRK